MDASFKLKVAAPCTAAWSSMTGDERVRFCGLCKKNVFNLSEMSREEALALVREVEGGQKVCGRFYQRADGTVLTRDCPVGWRRRMRRRLAFTAAMFGGFFGLFATARAAIRSRDPMQPKVPPAVDFWPVRDIVEWIDPDEPARMIMGEMIAPPPAAPAGGNAPAPGCAPDAGKEG